MNGGFGVAPKFPHPTAVSFLLWVAFSRGEERERGPGAARRCLGWPTAGCTTRSAEASTGTRSTRDGTFRTSRRWGVDNAALLSAYVEGARRFAEPRFSETVTGTVGWVRDTSRTRRGVRGEPGRGQRPGRRRALLHLEPVRSCARCSRAEELRSSTRFFGIGTDGRMPHDPEQNVLYRMLPVPDLARALSIPESEARRQLDRAIDKLRSARSTRAAPVVDRARYANINGPMIAAHAQAARLLDDPRPLESARAAADAFLARGFDPSKGVAHRLDADGASGYGLLEDNAGFAWGLVELAGTTADPRYMAAASQSLDFILRAFRSDNGLLGDLAPSVYDGPALGPVTEPSYPLEDTPHVSPNRPERPRVDPGVLGDERPPTARCGALAARCDATPAGRRGSLRLRERARLRAPRHPPGAHRHRGVGP